MQQWIPVPGTAKARLIEAALHEFEDKGFEGSSVIDIAAKAGVTTGSLYHHFESKRGLYTLIRGDLEKRLADRMEGAGATSPPGRPAVRAALLVAFDAAVRFDACRILGEPPPFGSDDLVEVTLQSLLPKDHAIAGVVLTAAWRSALLSVADGEPSTLARRALEFVLRP